MPRKSYGKCPICETAFEKFHRNHKYCGKKCYRVAASMLVAKKRINYYIDRFLGEDTDGRS